MSFWRRAAAALTMRGSPVAHAPVARFAAFSAPPLPAALVPSFSRMMPFLHRKLVKYRCRYSNEQSFWKRSVPGMPGASAPLVLKLKP